MKQIHQCIKIDFHNKKQYIKCNKSKALIQLKDYRILKNQSIMEVLIQLINKMI